MKRVFAIALALGVFALSLGNIGCGDTKPTAAPTKAPAPGTGTK